MNMKMLALAGFAALALPLAPADARTPAPDGAGAYIASPDDGATVSSPVSVVFGLSGMGVAPAGVEKENTGHHHLLINVDPDTVDMDSALPAYQEADEAVIHFGGGQTETSVELEPGTYTLRILLGDHNHIPHDPPILSDAVTITVE